MRIRRSVLTVALVLGLLGAILTSSVASARHTGPGGISTSVKTLVAVLYGDAEVPGPGDPYGFGVAVISLDELNGRGRCESTAESGARASWVMDQCISAYYRRGSGMLRP